MLKIIGAVLKVIFLVLTGIFERNKDIKEKKKELRKELTGAIKSKDTSRINATIGRINRM